MNWTKLGRVTLAGLCLLGGAHAQATGTLFAGFGGTSDGVSTRSATTLTEIGSFGVGGTLTGIEAGQGENLYITADDTISNVNTAGGILATDTVSGAAYSDVALLGAEIFVTSAGATPGVSARDLNTLVESNFFDTAFTPTSIEDGFGRLYITAGDTLFILNATGAELANASTGTAGVTFVGSAISGTRLYAATGGSANSISVRNPITLAEITSFDLSFPVEGIVAGDNDDLFITSGANVFHISTSGEELDSVVDSTAGRAFSDIAFISSPLPPAVGTVLAITAEGAGNSILSRDAESLADAGSFDIVTAATGVALTASNELILAAGDTLFLYGTGGALLDEVVEAGTVFDDVAVVGTDVIATTATGFSIRDAGTLAETSNVDLGFTPTAITAAADPDEVYITSGNVVSRYTTAGVLQDSFSGSSAFEFTDVALVSNVVYATFVSTGENGISVLDPTSLIQSDTIGTSIAATGITPGGANDYYISGGDTIVHYALDEVLASTTVGGAEFPDLVFSMEGSESLTSVVAATLPGVRSVQVGDIASAFATIINTGTVTASGCAIEPATTVPADFSYQETDPGTNELVGSANTPVNIASMGSQSFLITFTPTAAFDATDIELDFECVNAPAAPVFSGLNTVLLVADDDPVPDVVALASTPFTPGVVDIPGVGGTGFFAVASVNVGVTGDIAVIAEITDGNPAVTLSVCETNPATGACINPTAPTTDPVLTTIEDGATPTFSIFAQSSEAITLDPAGTRVQVNFTDETGGTIRGATSVAIRTQ